MMLVCTRHSLRWVFWQRGEREARAYVIVVFEIAAGERWGEAVRLYAGSRVK